MYGDTTTTPGGKALKFYSSVRVETRKKGGSTVKEKVGAEEIPVGHTIACTVKKNKTAPPYRRAEYQVFYDGRHIDKLHELAMAVLNNGLIPKYDAKGNVSATGRRYIYDLGEEHLEAHKKDDVEDALRDCPKMQEHFLGMLRTGNFGEEQNIQDTTDSEMTEEEFEEQMKEDLAAIENGDSAEEIEDTSKWDDV